MSKFNEIVIKPFRTLRNKTFGKIFVSQLFSLFADAFIWLGLALLSYELNPERSAVILASALTMRVTAYILFSPFSGVISEHFNRKNILWITQSFRIVIVGLLPFVTSEWQLFLLIFLLNVAAAFFTPTYRAIIPQVVDHSEYREANGLSMATFQLLSVFGPALAGVFATWLGAKQLFLVSAISLLIGVTIILSISANSLQKGVASVKGSLHDGWHDVIKGVRLLFGNKILRFSLSMEFVSAIAGAMVLVNTVGWVKTSLSQDDAHYGLIMALFGVGGAITAFLLGSLDKTKTRALSLISGALLIGVAISFANFVSFNGLLALWVFAGIGQTLADLPSETLIGENIQSGDQGKVYGSHFAFSHLWWFIAYPFAGFLGTTFPNLSFLYGGIISISLAILAIIIFKPILKMRTNCGHGE
ncbi:MAG: MFS transporter [Bacteroidia bacterium 43-41]|nr:MAG: MFS transporter [Bacteroidia bacterium 43-41]